MFSPGMAMNNALYCHLTSFTSLSRYYCSTFLLSHDMSTLSLPVSKLLMPATVLAYNFIVMLLPNMLYFVSASVDVL